MVVMLMLDATASNWLLQEFSALTKSVMKAFCPSTVWKPSSASTELFLSLLEADDPRKVWQSSISCR